MLLQSIELDCDDCNLLIHIVMQLSCEPGALLLVSLNQSAAYAVSSFLGWFRRLPLDAIGFAYIAKWLACMHFRKSQNNIFNA